LPALAITSHRLLCQWIGFPTCSPVFWILKCHHRCCLIRGGLKREKSLPDLEFSPTNSIKYYVLVESNEIVNSTWNYGINQGQIWADHRLAWDLNNFG
jgi:hypothetical protein